MMHSARNHRANSPLLWLTLSQAPGLLIVYHGVVCRIHGVLVPCACLMQCVISSNRGVEGSSHAAGNSQHGGRLPSVHHTRYAAGVVVGVALSVDVAVAVVVEDVVSPGGCGSCCVGLFACACAR